MNKILDALGHLKALCDLLNEIFGQDFGIKETVKGRLIEKLPAEEHPILERFLK